MNVAFYMYPAMQLIAMLPWQTMVPFFAVALTIIAFNTNIKEQQMIQFNKKQGLCGNIICMHSDATEFTVLGEMRDQFNKAGLDLAHPFGQSDYWKNKSYASMHLCPKRLAWANDHYQYPPANQSKELTEFYGEWCKWAVAQSN